MGWLPLTYERQKYRKSGWMGAFAGMLINELDCALCQAQSTIPVKINYISLMNLLVPE